MGEHRRSDIERWSGQTCQSLARLTHSTPHSRERRSSAQPAGVLRCVASHASLTLAAVLAVLDTARRSSPRPPPRIHARRAYPRHHARADCRRPRDGGALTGRRPRPRRQPITPGSFTLEAAARRYTVTAVADGFRRAVASASTRGRTDSMSRGSCFAVAGVREAVTVSAPADRLSGARRSAAPPRRRRRCATCRSRSRSSRRN